MTATVVSETLSGTLTLSGVTTTFQATVSKRMIVLRVNDRTCIAAPRWLTDDERRELAAALSDAAS